MRTPAGAGPVRRAVPAYSAIPTARRTNRGVRGRHDVINSRVSRLPPEREPVMGLLVLLVVLAVVFGVVGLAVKGLIWLLFIGLILLVVSGVLGFTRRGA
ncbi:MAG: hypothetical protein NVSMB13_05530 [Mycobacteriales bacterium]